MLIHLRGGKCECAGKDPNCRRFAGSPAVRRVYQSPNLGRTGTFSITPDPRGAPFALQCHSPSRAAATKACRSG
eukprot:1317334-Pleurochrysis_carterae.AAC.1